jgi:hypothetical protein
VDGYLDAVRARGQVEGAGAAAVAQGVGDELRDDPDHGVGSLGCDRMVETFEEIPGALACAGDGCRGAERTVATLTLVVSIRSPWSLSSMPGPVCPGLCPGWRPVNPSAVTALRLPSSLFEVDCLTVERAKIYVGRSRHWAVVWLWFLS